MAELRKATEKDAQQIWKILKQSIERRLLDGSQQWQNGYPNENTVKNDIENGYGFVLTDDNEIVAYAALIENDEPAYLNIDGQWLSEGAFLVIHRVGVSDKTAGKGYAKEIFRKIEEYTRKINIPSIKVDTNFDNGAMLHILEKLGYTYCGEVMMMGAPRKAFEKIVF